MCTTLFVSDRLSKVIAQRWRDLPEAGKDFYRNLARADWSRYQAALKQPPPQSSMTSTTTTGPQHGGCGSRCEQWNDDDSTWRVGARYGGGETRARPSQR